MSLKAIVKFVISSDTLVLRGHTRPQGQPESPRERILHLADVMAPRMGSQNREDEPWAFESRDFLRTLAVGKEISYISTHSLPSNGDVTRDLVTAEIKGVDVASEILKNGWAKVKESKRAPTEDDIRKRVIEAEAKATGKGLWNSHGPQARVVHRTMPSDEQVFISEWRGKSIDALVEQVWDGSTLRVRLFMPDGDHQMANIALAGVRCAGISSKQGEPSEPWAEEVLKPDIVCGAQQLKLERPVYYIVQGRAWK
ncbi:staphylococcal nuclease [Suillus decipiens]|nr:staphylococcal nuclease [Suillus decipiens]